MDEIKTDFHYEVVIVGGGPAGLSAGIVLAKNGVKTLLIERGRFCGAKNLFGGIVYTEAIKEIIPEFPEVNPSPVERSVYEEGYIIVTEKGIVKITHTKADPQHAFTALRAKFDQFLAEYALGLGLDLAPKTKVIDFLRDDKGKIVGVVVDRPQSFKDLTPARITSQIVILAEGVNRLLSRKAGLITRDFAPEEVVLSVKEVLQLPKGEMEKRLGLKEEEGLAWEILGSISQGLPGLGFLYTNQNSLSFGIGIFLSALATVKIPPYEILEKAKAHPFFQKILANAEILEYGAHLIPEWGIKGFPKLYGKGVLACGDAVGLVNPLFREGTNLAIYSGIMAAETALSALKVGDFSEKTLAQYEEKIRSSYFYKDLLLAKELKTFLLKNPQLFTTYPELLYEALNLYFSAQGRLKQEVLKEIWRLVRRKRGVLGVIKDFINFLKLFW